MTVDFRDILNVLPDKPSRSRLEPYRELIEELRRRKRTFKEIAEVLTREFGVPITGSGVHDFQRRRKRVDAIKASAPRDGSTKAVTDSAQQPIRSFIAREAAQGDSSAFDFDPSKPLRLAGRNMRSERQR